MHNCALELVGYLGVRDYVPAVGGRDALPGSDGGGETDSEGLSLGTEGAPQSLLTLLTRSGCRARRERADFLTATYPPAAVYTNSSRSLTLVLPRAPVIRARKAHHLDAMHRFVAAGGFRDVLVVAGVDAAMRGDEALNA